MTPFLNRDEIDWESYDLLIEWYLGQGAHGLFASCLSSESLSMSPENRIQLVERAVKVASGRVPVVGGVMGCVNNHDREEMAKAMAASGSTAAVVPLGEVVNEGQTDIEWIREMEIFLDKIPDISVGLYECPAPYKRMLTPELTDFVVSAKRFCFLKETSCDLEEQSRKCEVGTPIGFKIFNAHADTTLASYRRGLQGYCGIQSNLWTDLHVRMFECWKSNAELADRIQRFCSNFNWALSRSYPASAKVFAALRMQHDIPTLSFLNDSSVNRSDMVWLEKLHEDYLSFVSEIEEVSSMAPAL